MSIQRSPIAVVGAGSWGSALSLLLANNGNTVHLWDRDNSLLTEIHDTKYNTRYLPDIKFPDNITICDELAEALHFVQDILIAVPSHAFAKTLKGLKPFLTSKHRLVWATKGLEPETGYFLHQVATRELGEENVYAILSGPSFAKEVALGLPTAVMIASKNALFINDLTNRFSCETFCIYATDDILGVQLGGVVKNVLAVAVGISDGIAFGANARAFLITRGLTEMIRLGEALGAHRETLMGLAGCGDVILTCTDNQSRNRRFGLLLAKGLTETQALEQIGQVVEAKYNVEQLDNLAKQYQIDLPVITQVLRIMKEGISPREALSVLFKKVPESK